MDIHHGEKEVRLEGEFLLSYDMGTFSQHWTWGSGVCRMEENSMIPSLFAPAAFSIPTYFAGFHFYPFFFFAYPICSYDPDCSRHVSYSIKRILRGICRWLWCLVCVCIVFLISIFKLFFNE